MNLLEHFDCKFEGIVSDDILKMLDEEFQYQMDLTDGTYVFWYDSHFNGHQVEPATDGTGQAILQYFSGCGCPISMLRLGRSLSKRNYQHGPIISHALAVKYLIKGLEQLNNSLFDENVRDGMLLYMQSKEFLVACSLISTYAEEINGLNLCPEIKGLIEGSVGLRNNNNAN